MAASRKIAHKTEKGAGAPADGQERPYRLRMVVRIGLGALLALAALSVWLTNAWLGERYSATTRARTELRATAYSGALVAELGRNAVVPQLLSRDPNLISALESGDFSTVSARLIGAQQEIGAANIRLLDAAGRVVGATDRQQIGALYASQPFFIEAMRSSETGFHVGEADESGYFFVHSRAVRADELTLGVIAVASDLNQLERSWASVSDAVVVTDGDGTIILTTEPRWRGLTLDEALTVRSAPSAIERAFQVTADWASSEPDAYMDGRAVMQVTTKLPFRNWQMVSFTTYDSARDKVNTVIALEITAFALLVAGLFWLTSRRARLLSRAYARDAADLRALNQRLTREIAARERAQNELREAEQTVLQSSKLAALGEMSAGVSHELNQPLAAMKTYLAGARLLLERGRPEEALTSFQRIDDLIDRMGAITRQLKSYVRKGGEAVEPVDLRDAVSAALTLMEPRLRDTNIRIRRDVPDAPVMVMADRIRLEQVLVNLLRNAFDAVKSRRDPQVQITVEAGAHAYVSVRDNGPGVSDLEKLFEPFWTTKSPGEGTGLGLAISSGIVTDFEGRLTGRNHEEGGAIFVIELPLAEKGDAL